VTRARAHRRRAAVLAALWLGLLPPLAGTAGAGAPGGSASLDPPPDTAAGARPAVLDEIGFDQRLDAELPRDLAFRDEDGRTVRLGDYFGERPVVLVLAYYECPMLCTLVLNGLLRALRVINLDVGRDFEVVTVSFDARETPALAAAKKAAYLEQYGREGAAAGWHFLTGEGPAIERLAQAVGFRFTWVPEQEQFAHAAAIMVATPAGRLARYFYGVEYPPRDLRLGLVEAADGTIGSPVDQVLLYCLQYDPTTGRYSAVALNLVRLGGVATMLALGGFILISRRRERARQGGA